MASEQNSSGPALNEMTPGTVSSGLVRTSSPSTSYVPPLRNDWDLVFQPMFDELLNPLPSVVNQAPEVISPIAEVIPLVHADSTNSPSLTTVDQDVPSLSKTHTTTKIQSSVIPQDVGDDNLDMEVTHMGNDPLFGVAIPEAKTYKEALTQSCWIEAMQEELNDFERLEVWVLVPQPDQVMVAVKKKGLTLKSRLLREKVYVSQPDGFLDLDNPNHVYKIKKALYGLKQAPRAWYDMLSLFLLSQDFSKGSVDPTLFIRRNGTELLLMSMMGKISFFLGLQISQSPRGIFINQSKYALESLKKYGFKSCDPVDIPMVEKSKLDEDKEGKPLIYHIIVARPTKKHVHAVKRIFQYLRRTVHRGLWYPKDSSVALIAFADADHAGCQDTSRSTSGSVQFLRERLISWSSKRQKSAAISSTEAKYIALSGCYAQIL
nr:hypothetical protein [Tanacetum cinerariifolium]